MKLQFCWLKIYIATLKIRQRVCGYLRLRLLYRLLQSIRVEGSRLLITVVCRLASQVASTLKSKSEFVRYAFAGSAFLFQHYYALYITHTAFAANLSFFRFVA